MIHSPLLLAAALVVAGAAPGAAQDEAALVRAFGGDWFAFDPDRASGSATCQIALSRAEGAEPAGGRPATATSCAAPLDAVATWRIEDAMILLADGGDATLARLGGNQVRISGEVVPGGAGVVLERRAGDARSEALRTAIGTYRCLFRGYADTCATPAELAQPTLDGPEDTARISTLVSLNARTQPRGDAPVVGVVSPQETIVVNDCLVASDGLWCRASFGDQDAWMARSALREGTWPVMTFTAMPE